MSRPGILSACYTFPEDDVSSSTAALLVHLWQMEMDGQIYVKDDAAPYAICRRLKSIHY